MPLENRRDVLIALATDADRLGYEAFCLPETWAYDVTVLLAEAAVMTKHLTPGTGILAVRCPHFRHPRARGAARGMVLAVGAARGREAPAEPSVAPSVRPAVAEDGAVARQGAAWFVALHLTTMGALYRQSLVGRGFAK